MGDRPRTGSARHFQSSDSIRPAPGALSARLMALRGKREVRGGQGQISLMSRSNEAVFAMMESMVAEFDVMVLFSASAAAISCPASHPRPIQYLRRRQGSADWLANGDAIFSG